MLEKLVLVTLMTLFSVKCNGDYLRLFYSYTATATVKGQVLWSNLLFDHLARFEPSMCKLETHRLIKCEVITNRTKDCITKTRKPTPNAPVVESFVHSTFWMEIYSWLYS